MNSDDSDGDDDANDDPFGHLNVDTLTIHSQLLDDLFTGTASKMRYFRDAAEDHLRMLFQV